MVRVRSSNLWGGIILLLFPFGICAGTAMALSGSGAEQDPWLIQSLSDFDEFASDANYWDDYTRLETDVNLAGRVYDRAVIGSFSGVFDGNDREIIGLTIDDDGGGNNYLGLFSSIDRGEVSNLGLEGGSVTGTGDYVGGLVGYIEAGYMETDASIVNCYSTVNIRGGGFVGGLAGYLDFYGSIVNCYSTGNVNGGSSVGGLVGSQQVYTAMSNCFSTGNVSGEKYVGGLVGMGYRPVKSHYAGNATLGIPAPAKSTTYGISNCYATGDVNGVDCVGGLAGLNPNYVSNSYSTGRVTGTGDDTGGLFGRNGMITTFGCEYGRITGCYWNTETSGELEMCGNRSACSDAGCEDSCGRTTSQLQQQGTFTNWDFINVWNIGENQTYPYLRTVPAGDINKDKTVNFLDVCIIADQWCNEQ